MSSPMVTDFHVLSDGVGETSGCGPSLDGHACLGACTPVSTPQRKAVLQGVHGGGGASLPRVGPSGEQHARPGFVVTGVVAVHVLSKPQHEEPHVVR